MRVFSAGCQGEMAPHLHVNTSGWFTHPSMATALFLVRVDYHDPHRGTMEGVSVPIEAPAHVPPSPAQPPEAIVICGHIDLAADLFCVARRGHPGPHGYTPRAYFEAASPLRPPAAPSGTQGEG